MVFKLVMLELKIRYSISEDMLEKIKEIEERTLAIYRDLKFKNLDLLEVSLSDIYQKAKWGANLPQ